MWFEDVVEALWRLLMRMGRKDVLGGRGCSNIYSEGLNEACVIGGHVHWLLIGHLQVNGMMLVGMSTGFGTTCCE
jgi:hypothetical protein